MGTSISFNGGGVSAATIQTLAVTGSATKWNSVVETTGGLASTVTLAQALTAAVGTTITVRNTGAGAVTVAPFAGDAVTGQTAIASGGSVTYMVMAAGAVKSIQDVATSAVAVPLARAVMKLGADWLNISANDLYQKVQFNTVVYDSDTAYSPLTFQYVVPKAGDYHTDVVLSYTNNGANSNDAITIVVRKNGASDALALRHNISNVAASVTEGLTATLSGIVPGLLAGDVLSIEMLDADDIMVTTAASFWSIQQLASATTVNAGAITPTPLQHAMGVVAAGVTVPAAGAAIPFTYSTGAAIIAANTIALKAGKTYMLTASLARVNGPLNSELTYQFRDTTLGVDLGSPGVVSSQTVFSASGGAQALVTPAVATNVQLWVKKNITSSTIDTNSGTNAGSVVVVEMPASTVVDPSGIVPTTLNHATGRRTTAQGVTTAASIAAPQTVVFDQLSVLSGAGISIAAGVITLAGGTYRVDGGVAGASGGRVQARWYLDNVAGGSVNEAFSPADLATQAQATGAAVYEFTCGAGAQLKLGVIGATANVNIGLQSDSGNSPAWFTIQQLPAGTIVAAGSAVVITDDTLATATIANVASALTVKNYVDENTKQPNVIAFTAAGTYTPSAGMKWVEVEMVAGGGGGGGSAATANTTVAVAGSGGAGGYLRTRFTAAQVGASQVITIGAAGAAGAAGAVAGTGGTTSFGALASVAGGGGGTVGVARVGVTATQGGLGGAVTLAGGTVMASRQGDAASYSFGAISGTSVSTASGNGASSPWGNGGRAATVNGSTAVALGSLGFAATGFGSGGSGAMTSGTAGVARVGTLGAPGRLLVTEHF